MGYQVTTVTPANMRAQRGGRVAVDDDLAAGLVHALDAEWVGLGAAKRRRSRNRPWRRSSSARRLSPCLANCLRERLLHLGHVEVEQLGHDADVDHVPDQLAQLGLGADRRRDLVVRDGVEGQVGAQLVELERLVVERDRARRQRQARLPSRSRGSWRSGNRFPSCARCNPSCWRGWCTRSEVRRCSTGTCSCRKLVLPSGKSCAAECCWRSASPSR